MEDFIWIASYPRSGNTYLRTILRHVFGLRSASIYPNDLAGNKALEAYVGHVEYNSMMQKRIHNEPLLIKTHEYARDNRPAIYIIRDGRAACVSLWKFYDCTKSMESVVEGFYRFGTWGNHVKSWGPWARPNTLLLKYEDLRDDLPMCLEMLSQFLKIEVVSTVIPDRDIIAAADGKWVKKETDWRAELNGENLRKFMEINGEILNKAGYL
ncbi:MAG: sulfotransferase domain-containing protein [Zetaproteobacteria bacterium]|nr:sulfotransferase domain-containing protein [Zetaproteobacteria bacterium]